MKKLHFLLLITCLIFLSSCAAKRQARLEAYQSKLAMISIEADATPEQKLDALAVSTISMMEEALRVVNPKKGAKYVKSYVNMNEGAMESIITDVVKWQQELTPAERTKFGLSLLTKSYTRDLVMLVPKFTTKYKAYKSAVRFGGKLKNGLLDIGKNSTPFGGLLGGGNKIFNFETK